MKRTIALLCAAVLALGLIGCSEKEETTSTVTGIVVSVDGTVVTLRTTDTNGQGSGRGERPSAGKESPEGNFTMPEGDFTMPEGGFERPEGDFTMPEGGFERPEGNFTMPEGMEGITRPEVGFDPNNMPEGMTMPTMPEGGSMQGETTTVDLKNAHISVQDGDIRAAGSLSDIKAGSFLTVTLNSKGEATEVLVSTMSGFGGGFSGTGFGGGFGGKGQGSKLNNSQSA